MPKRIAIISSHFPPENTAASNRLQSFYETLSIEHHLEVYHLLEKGMKAQNNINEIKGVEQHTFSSKNFALRFYYELIGAFNLLKQVKKKNYDSYLISIPYLSLIFLPLFLKKNTVVLDVRDVVWRYLERGLIANLFKIIFDFIYKIVASRCKAIIVTNSDQLKILKSIKTHKNYQTIYNGITKDKFNIISQIPKLNLRSKLTITYVGNIGLAQNLTTFAQAAKELTNCNFLIIGDGVDFDRVYNYAKENNVNNLKFIGKLNWSDLIEYYSKTDILYAQLKKEFKSAIPSKIFEYLATGKNVIYGGNGAIEELSTKFEGLNIITPDHHNVLISAIKSLEIKESFYHSKNIEIIANNYIRENSNKELLKFFIK